eukprot:4613745-Amphidinium_carterae.1
MAVCSQRTEFPGQRGWFKTSNAKDRKCAAQSRKAANRESAAKVCGVLASREEMTSRAPGERCDSTDLDRDGFAETSPTPHRERPAKSDLQGK